MASRGTTWLIRANGDRLQISRYGVLIGVSPGNDIHLTNAGKTPVHAAVLPTPNGLELVAMGCRIVRTARDGPVVRARLSDGDWFEVGGERFLVECTKPCWPAQTSWWVEAANGSRYGLRVLPVTIGGSEEDQICHTGWPPGAVTAIEGPPGDLLLHNHLPAVIDGRPVPADTETAGHHGLRLTSGELDLTLHCSPDPLPITLPVLPNRVRLKFRPNGATLDTWFLGRDQSISVELSELRARLLAVLLAPPGDSPGEPVADPIVASAVWPRERCRDRLDINQLVHRTRRVLERVGLDGNAILVRNPKGGSTRFCTEPRADIQVVV